MRPESKVFTERITVLAVSFAVIAGMSRTLLNAPI
jgi:hypothetical protein